MSCDVSLRRIGTTAGCSKSTPIFSDRLGKKLFPFANRQRSRIASSSVADITIVRGRLSQVLQVSFGGAPVLPRSTPE